MGSNVPFGEQWLSPCNSAMTPWLFCVFLRVNSWIWTLAKVRKAFICWEVTFATLCTITTLLTQNGMETRHKTKIHALDGSEVIWTSYFVTSFFWSDLCWSWISILVSFVPAFCGSYLCRNIENSELSITTVAVNITIDITLLVWFFKQFYSP